VAAAALGTVQFDADVSRSGQHLVLSEGLLTGGPIPNTADLVLYELANGVFQRRASSWFGQVNNPSALEYAATLSADERSLYFTRILPGQPPALWRANRPEPQAEFGPPSLLPGLGAAVEAPTLSSDSSLMYYHLVEPQSTSLWAVTPP
jgi:hypothetical protein